MSRVRPARFVAVIDIGKTNAKLALVDLDIGSEIAVRRIANRQLRSGPYPHADIAGIWDFLCQSLADLNRQTPIDAISATTHGASAALVTATGGLALPVLDYEHRGPDDCEAEYARARPAFSQSLTPRLPGGLNLGKQLFWQARRFSAEFSRAKWILPYPQYWGFRLSGVAATEITSIGCHTDLWNFGADRFSDLVTAQGWRRMFAAFRPARAVLGPIRPALAQKLGLRAGIPVHVGIHDSNASLLPHLMARTAPFAVVSTGTWVVVCAPGGDLENLDAGRDSYANIDALGQHVPSARFMGGREFSDLIGEDGQQADLETIKRVLKYKWMLLPSVSRGSGPFPTLDARMTVAREDISAQAHYAIVSIYLAMMTAQCLDLAAASGDIIVEGPFVKNNLFLQMLRSATGRPVLAQKSSRTGTSVGAALLVADSAEKLALAATIPVADQLQSDLAAYAQEWRKTTRMEQGKF